MEILHRDDLTLGGFAGLREHRLVMGSKVFGGHREPGTWDGIGNFVYLAERFMKAEEFEKMPIWRESLKIQRLHLWLSGVPPLRGRNFL